MDMIDYLGSKESYTHLKLMLVKIAAMLNEDVVYTREMAFNDVLKVIQKIEHYDTPIEADVTNSILGKAPLNW
jgi:hypothetical protein